MSLFKRIEKLITKTPKTYLDFLASIFLMLMLAIPAIIGSVTIACAIIWTISRLFF